MHTFNEPCIAKRVCTNQLKSKTSHIRNMHFNLHQTSVSTQRNQLFFINFRTSDHNVYNISIEWVAMEKTKSWIEKYGGVISSPQVVWTNTACVAMYGSWDWPCMMCHRNRFFPGLYATTRHVMIAWLFFTLAVFNALIAPRNTTDHRVEVSLPFLDCILASFQNSFLMNFMQSLTIVSSRDRNPGKHFWAKWFSNILSTHRFCWTRAIVDHPLECHCTFEWNRINCVSEASVTQFLSHRAACSSIG